MGLTLREFQRSLPSAVQPFEFELDGRCASIRHPKGTITIQLHDTTQRRLGSLSLPTTPVEFCFSGLTAEERGEFMGRFDRYFQRGGG